MNNRFEEIIKERNLTTLDMNIFNKINKEMKIFRRKFKKMINESEKQASDIFLD